MHWYLLYNSSHYVGSVSILVFRLESALKGRPDIDKPFPALLVSMSSRGKKNNVMDFNHHIYIAKRMLPQSDLNHKEGTRGRKCDMAYQAD